MHKIKVLTIGQLPKVVGGSYTTGIANVVYELSKHKISGVEITVFSTNTEDSIAQNISNANCSYLGYKKNYLCMIGDMIKSPRQTLRAWKLYRKTNSVSPLHIEFIKYNLKRVIRLVKPDLIHVHNNMDALYFANLFSGIPVLYTLHGLMWCGEDVDDPQEKKWKNNAQLLLPLAKYYTTLNGRALGKMVKLGVDENKIIVIPNGVDVKKFYYSQRDRNKMREDMRVSDNTLVFITVGTVIDRKGQLDFLKIISKMGVNYQYWIIGNGPDVETIKQYAKDNHIENNVRLLGYVEDIYIYKYHSAADFYVHGSTVEGQSLAEIEAYATGLRTIVNKLVSDTIVGDISDKNHYFVLDFNRPDVDSLDDWIKTTIGGRTSFAQCDWSLIANKYGEIYKHIFNHNW